jgi:hypothetical protein
VECAGHDLTRKSLSTPVGATFQMRSHPLIIGVHDFNVAALKRNRKSRTPSEEFHVAFTRSKQRHLIVFMAIMMSIPNPIMRQLSQYVSGLVA